MKGKRRTARACLMGIVLMLAACGGTSGTTGQGALSTPAPTVTPTTAPTATATATAAPTTVPIPAGWRTYQGPHFTIAYPPTWTEATQAQGGSTPSQPIIAYAFTAANGAASGFVSVIESDNLTAATIQNTYCKNTSGEKTVTFAGLPMRFSQTTSGEHTRSWVLITNAGVVYQVYANDFLASASDYLSVVAQNTTLASTFQPQYTTPGC
jgi:hypothetical protein